jgi:23S rRNA (guanosine2251-2'-O)-methyltransferase
VRIVYGMNPVRELLRAGGDGVSELWLAQGGTRAQAFGDLERLGREAGAKVRAAPREKLDRLAGTDRHQGVVAVVADFRYAELDELLQAPAAGADGPFIPSAGPRPSTSPPLRGGYARDERAGPKTRGEPPGSAGVPPLLVVLDGVEDPHNLGAIVRSGLALGATGIVIPRDRAVGVTPAVAKASAGAVERSRIARVVNVAKTLDALKERGVWSVALAADGDRPLGEVDLTGPIALVLGSEAEGIRPLVRKTCDLAARIPMEGAIDSLSVSAAAAVALYEAARQRAAAKAGGASRRPPETRA